MLDNLAAQAFEIRPSPSGIGADVIGIDLAKPLSDRDFKRISDAFNDHAVLVYRDQHLTPEQHIAFSRRWGPVQVQVHGEVPFRRLPARRQGLTQVFFELLRQAS